MFGGNKKAPKMVLFSYPFLNAFNTARTIPPKNLGSLIV
ncbi:Stage V sporulation [Geobacillus thermoleovorans CCB_US3_UF5]|uniref:Uncharacterized protein n=3 Tax=Geobacillus TaxID=129337 RepID=A0A1Q5SKW7_9BACL|nr:Stage V sporulation [Geobacillus thermoleovorans CCB_US3_UF5]EPR27339.1 hypothetical protein I656_03027 [Geobacillus sp. WSUCF1]OKO88556.1 hypothetical protein BRO54_3612 [Geobacillus proteiniphilus]GAD12115.1 stage V sporulation [Geobacillus kaustophilus GBlys]GAJ59504.1 hypothetical protein B23_2729 [Geobacillus thermoleovorans B23]